MKKRIYILNLLLAILIIAGDIWYMIGDSTIVKGITSGVFVIMGIINLIYAIKNKTKYKEFAILMVVGLFFAMLGDILLEIEFIVGAGFFALGHVLFFVSYCFIQKFNIKDIFYGALIFIPATLVILLVPIFEFNGLLMQIVCIIYAVIISCMVGKAINNYIIIKNKLTLIVLIGSILFIISDICLLFNVFASVPKFIGVMCLLTYYPAEIFLACGVLFEKYEI